MRICFSVAKHVIMDNGEVDMIGSAIDKENLHVLRANIDAVLKDDSNKIERIKLTYDKTNN